MSGNTRQTPTTRTARDGLKLRARDAEDLEALSAVLQDALVPLGDVAFFKSQKRFVLVANRFRWERAPDRPPEAERAHETEAEPGDAPFETEAGEAGPPYQRINCGLCFDRVRAVRVRGLDPRRKDQILNLLAIRGGSNAVALLFSDGVEIRLEGSGIHCHLEDLGEPWPTRWRPDHPGTGAPESGGESP
ncbi:MAG TPA: DUF2948 family protein [Kiloniellales bacterium]|nr:DUF2948 family protein [Kiloniellales bacterium]